MVFREVPLQEVSSHCLPSTVVADREGLKKQEHSSGGVCVGVVFAADKIQDLVAKGEVAKNSLWTRLLPAFFPEDAPYTVCHRAMLDVGFTIDQESPIHITAICRFLAGQRSKHNNARIFVTQPAKVDLQTIEKFASSLPCMENMLPALAGNLAQVLKSTMRWLRIFRWVWNHRQSSGRKEDARSLPTSPVERTDWSKIDD